MRARLKGMWCRWTFHGGYITHDEAGVHWTCARPRCGRVHTIRWDEMTWLDQSSTTITDNEGRTP